LCAQYQLFTAWRLWRALSRAVLGHDLLARLVVVARALRAVLGVALLCLFLSSKFLSFCGARRFALFLW
jgi:hypothetical protein